MRRLLSIALVTLASGPALAGASAWQELAPGVRARLVSSDTLSDGHTMAGLEIQLPPDTHTYWRLPGETGIPTEISLAASTGISSPDIYWPVPTVDDSSGFRDYVYDGALVVPFAFGADPAGVVLNAHVTLGVCSDMCIPASADLTLPVTFGAPDAAQSIRIDQAMAQTPAPWDQPKPPFSEVTAAPDGSIHLAGPNALIDPGTLIADIGDPSVVLSAPQKSPDGTLWTLRPLGLAGTTQLAGRAVQLTFMTPNGPYVVTRTLNTSAPQ